MNLYATLSLLAFLVDFHMGFFAYSLEKKSRLNRQFLILCICFGIWSFCNVFISTSDSIESCRMWYRLSAIGWSIIPGVALHFFLILTERIEGLNAKRLYFMLYAPGVAILLITSIAKNGISEFLYIDNVWFVRFMSSSFWYWIYLVYMSYVAVGIYITWQWGKVTEKKRYRKQSEIILKVCIIAFPIGVLRGFVLPVYYSNLMWMSSLEVLLTLIWAGGMGYAILKHKLMMISPKIVSDEIMSNTLDYTILLDDDMCIISMNHIASDVLRDKNDHFIGARFSEILARGSSVVNLPEDEDRRLYEYDDYGAEFLSLDGEKIPVNISVSRVKGRLGEVIGYVVVAHDMRLTLQLKSELEKKAVIETELLAHRDHLGRMVEEKIKELTGANIQLRELASELSITEERERRRIATYIHDTLSQSLVIAKMKLDFIKGSDLFVENRPAIDEVYELLNEAVSNTRSLTFEISVPILYELGLVPAVEWLCEQLTHRHGIKFKVTSTGVGKKLKEDIDIFLFKSIRELMLNIVKHASAENVSIKVQMDEDKFIAEVRDDGVGLSELKLPLKATDKGGFGLFSINERIKCFDGELIVNRDIDNSYIAIMIPYIIENLGSVEYEDNIG